MLIPKLTIKGLGSTISARVITDGLKVEFKFDLYHDDELIQTSGKVKNGIWVPKQALNPGKYRVDCVVYLGERTEKLQSRIFEFGINKQSVKPRGHKTGPKHQPPASFYSLLYWESRKAHSRRSTSAWLLDNKTNAYDFAKLLGFETPALESTIFTAANIPLESNTVVKPLTGVMSQGVFIIKENQIIDLVKNVTLENTDHLRQSMITMVAEGIIKEDQWIRERLIFGDHDSSSPARDLKFYTFYGEPFLSLETVRMPKVERCWYDNYSNLIDTGKYSNELFVGYGIPDEYYAIAAEIGKNVPAPFVRVDLLASPDGAVLNEITPKPGGAHLFATSIDQKLGNFMIGADARLRSELIEGKDFKVFNQIKNQN
ncbi:ATP-grasp fold amidoligase family protein [Glutamicibacter ardleyensis]|uniref:ATP-grasp fold amidoligase family protein n=1 Tax=Glutamicibacter ardleyensis TaxID=225894 RepID=UPI003F91747D